MAEVRSGMKSKVLGASLADFGALTEARNEAWQPEWRGADLSLDVLGNDGGNGDVDLDATVTCGDEG